MKKYIGKFKKEGLPGGPNEVQTTMHGFIFTEDGQYDFPGMKTVVPGDTMTMENVLHNLLGISDNGIMQFMERDGGEYYFPGANMVYEIPLAQFGLSYGLEGTEDMNGSLVPSLNFDTNGLSLNASSSLPIESLKDYYKNLSVNAAYRKNLGRLGNLELTGSGYYNKGSKPDYNVGFNYNNRFKDRLGVNVSANSPLQNIKDNTNVNVGLTYNFQDGGIRGPRIVNDPESDRSYYDPISETITMSALPFGVDPKYVKEHEMFHHLQNMTGNLHYGTPVKRATIPSTDEFAADYYNRKGLEVGDLTDEFRYYNPEFGFVPDDVIYNTYIDYEQYNRPYTVEGEAQDYENYIRSGGNSIFRKNGGSLDKYQFGRQYKKFKESLPENLRNTNEKDYNLKYLWKKAGRPSDIFEAQQWDRNKSFEENYNQDIANLKAGTYDYTKGLFPLVEDVEQDGSISYNYHGSSIEPTTLKFLKSKDHPSLIKELEWYYSNDPTAVDFRNQYDLDKSGKFYQYIPKKQNIKKKGGTTLKKYQTGKTVSQEWTEITGTPWAQAKKLGLTKGSEKENLKLLNEIKKDPEKYRTLARGNSNLQPIERIEVQPEAIITEDVKPVTTAKSVTQPFDQTYRELYGEEKQAPQDVMRVPLIDAPKYTITNPDLLSVPFVYETGVQPDYSYEDRAFGESEWNKLAAVALPSPTGEFAQEMFNPLSQEAIGEYIPMVQSTQLTTPGPNAYKPDLSNCDQEQCSAGLQYNLASQLKGGFNEAHNKLGLQGNAWTMGENIIKHGGQRIYGLGSEMNINRSKNYDTKDIRKKLYEARKSYDLDKIYETSQVGDIVEMYYPGSDYQTEAIRDGKDNTVTTHIGHITEKDGVKYVTHNVHGTWHTDKLETLLSRSGNNKGTKGTVISGIVRPDYGWRDKQDENRAVSISPNPVQAISASGDRNYYQFGPADTDNDGKEDVVSRWQNKAINPTSQQFVKGIEAVAPTIAKDFGLSNDQLELVMRTSFGALGKESSFGVGEGYLKKARARKPLREYKKTAPDWFLEGDPLSEGLSQIKYDEIFKDPKTKSLLNKYGIKSEDQLYDPMYASIATMILGAMNYKQFELATGLKAEDVDPITLQNIMLLGHNKGMQNVINKDFTNEGELKTFSFLNRKGNKYKEGKEPTISDASIIRGLETYSNAHMNRKSYTNEGGDFAASLNIDMDKLMGPSNNENLVEYTQQELPEEYGLGEALLAGAYDKASGRDYQKDRDKINAEIEAAKLKAIKNAEKLYKGSKRKLRQAVNKIEKEAAIAKSTILNQARKVKRKVSSFEEGGQIDKIYIGKYTMTPKMEDGGGLKRWFAEEWTDIKTGKECGRSGKEKGSRPYPACRPKNRITSETPKTVSELSSAEKAKFKKAKRGKERIKYNHQRKNK